MKTKTEKLWQGSYRSKSTAPEVVAWAVVWVAVWVVEQICPRSVRQMQAV